MTNSYRRYYNIARTVSIILAIVLLFLIIPFLLMFNYHMFVYLLFGFLCGIIGLLVVKFKKYREILSRVIIIIIILVAMIFSLHFMVF